MAKNCDLIYLDERNVNAAFIKWWIKTSWNKAQTLQIFSPRFLLLLQDWLYSIYTWHPIFDALYIGDQKWSTLIFCCRPSYHNISSSVHFIMCDSSIEREKKNKNIDRKSFRRKQNSSSTMINNFCLLLHAKNHCGKRESMTMRRRINFIRLFGWCSTWHWLLDWIYVEFFFPFNLKLFRSLMNFLLSERWIQLIG